MATLNDIAQKAGVSTSTASRAFRNNASITPEMRDRVLRAARELGYTPNLLARSLKSNKSNLIGLDICNIDNPFYSTIIKSMEEELKKLGYQIVLSYSNGDYREERKNLELFAGTQAMGIVFMPNSARNKELVRMLSKRGVAIIQLFNQVYDFVDTISVMDDRGAYQATKHLIENGHKKILMLSVATPYSADRADGYRKAMAEAGIPVRDEYIIQADKMNVDNSDAIQALISQLKPTAVIAGVYSLGKNVVRACRKLNLRIPKDISVITFDDVEWPELLEITAVAQPVEYVGLSAVRMLLDRINGKIDSKQPVVTAVEPEMQIRKSVQNIKKYSR